MLPEKLPPVVAKSVLRRVQQNGRKKENDHGEKPWCVFFSHCGASHTCPPWGCLGWAQSSGWRLSSAPLIVPSLPEDPFPNPLQAYRDNEWEQEAKADGHRAFSLNSPVVLLCSGKEMKGWKLPGRESWTVSCWVTTHLIRNYCQMLSFFLSFSLKIPLFLWKFFMSLSLKAQEKIFSGSLQSFLQFSFSAEAL